MKNDREFIDGIYKKAAEYSAKSNFGNPIFDKRKNRHPIWLGTVTVMAAVLLAAVLRIRMITDKQDAGNNNNNNKIEPFSIMEPDDNSFNIIQILRTEADKSDIVITGEVTNKYNDEGYLYSEVKVKDCYQGISETNYIINIDISDIIISENILINQKALLFLINVGDNIYKPSDADESIFIYNENNELGGAYERYDGIIIYENILSTGIFSE